MSYNYMYHVHRPPPVDGSQIERMLVWARDPALGRRGATGREVRPHLSGTAFPSQACDEDWNRKVRYAVQFTGHLDHKRVSCER